MGIPQTLSSLALGPLVNGAVDAVGGKLAGAVAERVFEFLKDRFTDHSQRLNRALDHANTRAWKALEVALAGESFWERCQAALGRAEDQGFRDQVRAFLDAVPAVQLPAGKDEFRRQCLQELRQARKAGVLTSGALAPEQLARDAGEFARFDDPQQLLRAEKQAVGGMADELRRAGYAQLATLLTLGEGPSLLVVAARYFLRRAV